MFDFICRASGFCAVFLNGRNFCAEKTQVIMNFLQQFATVMTANIKE